MRSGAVTNANGYWCGHPDVARFKGRYYVCYRESEKHKAGSDTKINICSSKAGHIYEEFRTVMESSGGRYNCPRLKVIDDVLWLLCDCVNAKRGQDFVGAENDESNCRIHMKYTADGKNWSDLIETDISGIVPDRIFKTRSGTFNIVTHRFIPRDVKSSNGKMGSLGLDIWRSQSMDGPWERSTLCHHPFFNLCEGSICAVGKNKLVCMMRENSQKGFPASVVFSDDDGRTWGDFKFTRLFGCHRPVLGKLQSGRYLVTYREQTSGFSAKTFNTWSKNTFACLIDPASILDDCGDMIILSLDHDYSRRSDSGYTGWVQMADRSIYVVNYITQNHRKPFIKWYILSENEF